MALAQFDLVEEKFFFGSVGNVESRLLSSSAPANFLIRRGIVGVNAPEPVVTEHPWKAASLLVLHSDGLSTRWSWKDFPGLELQTATVISQRLLKALDKGEDDATAMVVKGLIP